jgi:hypothetical protein
MFGKALDGFSLAKSDTFTPTHRGDLLSLLKKLPALIFHYLTGMGVASMND